LETTLSIYDVEVKDASPGRVLTQPIQGLANCLLCLKPREVLMRVVSYSVIEINFGDGVRHGSTLIVAWVRINPKRLVGEQIGF
jgi:hypothetical protein